MSTSTVPLPEDWPVEWAHAAENGLCLHCGNSLGRFWRVDEGPFCCRGCRNVYHLILSSNLDRFYDLKPDSHAPAPNLRPDSYGWLDRLLEERGQATGSVSLDLDIQGVHCAACVWLIEELFRRQDAGVQLRINPALGKVEMTWDPDRGDLKAFLLEIERFGYRLGPSRKGGQPQSRALLMRMAIAIAMALNVMMFSLSFYFGLDEGALVRFFGWLSLGMATVSMVAGGGVFFRGAISGLRRRVLHLDVPIALGMTLAYAGSVYGFFTGGPQEAYFDSLTVFIALMLVGRWTQEHILQRNRNSLLESSGAENLTVRRVRGDDLEAVAATEIEPGDELWIVPGDLLPVQGILMRDSTEVSLDWITGESDQVAYQPGDVVPAGAFNASRRGFLVTAVETIADSRLQDLLRTTTVSDEDFRPRWWHQVSTWYVSLVLLTATAGFVSWAATDVTMALKVTIAILVVTCPCALGLATPLAEELVLFALRKAGVFVRKHSFLEKALSVRKVLLDKTGTLTMGQLELDPDSVRTLAGLSEDARAALFHMTGRSNHPVSMCLQAAMRREPGTPAAPAEGDLIETPGDGLEFRLDGAVWRLGRPGFALSVSTPDGDPGSRQTVFSRDGHPVAQFRLVEEIKADARTELDRLRDAGYSIYLLSGDGQAKVDVAAATLAIPTNRALGELDPEAKALQVARLDDQDTLMVGDGLNDSPSFEAAFCAATPAVDRPVLPGKADFFFLGDGIAAIGHALRASGHLRKVVRDNLMIAVAYNVAAVALCMAGLVTPVIAAILMPLSSVSVVSLTALRLAKGRSRWM